MKIKIGIQLICNRIQWNKQWKKKFRVIRELYWTIPCNIRKLTCDKKNTPFPIPRTKHEDDWSSLFEILKMFISHVRANFLFPVRKWRWWRRRRWWWWCSPLGQVKVESADHATIPVIARDKLSEKKNIYVSHLFTILWKITPNVRW